MQIIRGVEMSQIIIQGGSPLSGELTVQGAKNSALPLLSACVLVKGETILHSCPKLSDVDAAVKILEKLSCVCRREGNTLIIDSRNACACEIPTSLMREMRSSIVFLGAVLGRCKQAVLSFPGGCELGARPIDLHLSSLRKLNVDIKEKHGTLHCDASKGIIGTYIYLSFPSVGATENIILAATLAKGTTVIENSAKEPEIVDLANFLNACGAKIKGAGESLIVIEGVPELHSCEYSVMSDRIVAATYMAGAAMTKGEILLKKCPKLGLKTMLYLFEDAGCKTLWDNENLYLKAPKNLKSCGLIRTLPYPGFPTDAQAPIMAMACVSKGTTVFVENIFDSRYKHASELMRMGAKIKIEGKVAIVEGVEYLQGTTLESRELRGGASLVVAGLCANGMSVVTGTEYIDRGYENLEKNLRALGAKIYRE